MTARFLMMLHKAKSVLLASLLIAMIAAAEMILIYWG
jgi:hypothetical protein